jgi:hypothetical protein
MGTVNILLVIEVMSLLYRNVSEFEAVFGLLRILYRVLNASLRHSGTIYNYHICGHYPSFCLLFKTQRFVD